MCRLEVNKNITSLFSVGRVGKDIINTNIIATIVTIANTSKCKR